MTTIRDVAQRAGVTSATVSNVLTGRVGVSTRTRALVLEAIAELDYRPNLAARGLVQGKTFFIALLVPSITNPFFAEVVEEIERIADIQEYQIILSVTHNVIEQGRRHLDRMAGRSVDGFIVMNTAASIADVAAVAARNKPIVLCAWNEDLSTHDVPVVAIDFRYAGELATRHLTAFGHRRIAAILELAAQQERLQGYRTALAAAEIAVPPEYLRPGDSSFESGYHAAQELLALPTPPTAIFAGNDMMALGAMEAALEQGCKVPNDISIVGVDDIILAAHAHPALTTISVPKREMAQVAADVLLRRIDGQDTNPIIMRMMMRPQLVIRQSTAPYAGE